MHHARASLLLAQGALARTVTETLGYSTVTLTMNTYSHVMPELQMDAATKMDAILRGGWNTILATAGCSQVATL